MNNRFDRHMYVNEKKGIRAKAGMPFQKTVIKADTYSVTAFLSVLASTGWI
ncbi:hypothetical protein C7967_101219 [Thalassospira sp. 11-3]|nr:hypothetical protein C7967_101219 [Thalassospira sp. 11-3]